MKVIIAPTDPESPYAVEAMVSSRRDDLNIHDVMEIVVSALVAYGFSPDTVKDGVIVLAGEYKALDKMSEEDDDDGPVD